MLGSWCLLSLLLLQTLGEFSGEEATPLLGLTLEVLPREGTLSFGFGKPVRKRAGSLPLKSAS